MGGGCEVKRDRTLRKPLIDHLHKAGNCSLEALEFSTFLGCYLPTAPPPFAPPPPLPPPPQNQGSGFSKYHFYSQVFTIMSPFYIVLSTTITTLATNVQYCSQLFLYTPCCSQIFSILYTTIPYCPNVCKDKMAT